MEFRRFEVFGTVGRGPVWCLAGVPLAQLVPWTAIGVPQTIASDALIATAFGWGLYRAVVERRLAALTTWPVLVVALGLVFAALSALYAPEPLVSVISLFRVTEAFLIFPLTFLLVIRRRGDAVLFLLSLSTLGAVQAVIGILQTATGTGALYDDKYIRAVGTWGAANLGVLANISVVCFAVSLAGAMTLRGRLRTIAMVAAALNIAAILCGLSRASWFSIAVIGAVVLSRFSLKRTLAVIIGGMVTLGLLFTVASATDSVLGDRLLSFTTAADNPDQSQLDRLSLWQGAMDMVDDNPLFGIGPREFPHARDTYAPLTLLGSSDIGDSGSFSRQEIMSPHNLYLLMSSEFGIPAAGLLLGVIPMIMLVGMGRTRLAPATNSLGWICGLASAGMLCNILTDGVFGDLGGVITLNYGWSLGFAAWWAAHNTRTLALPKRRELRYDELHGLLGVPWWARESQRVSS